MELVGKGHDREGRQVALSWSLVVGQSTLPAQGSLGKELADVEDILRILLVTMDGAGSGGLYRSPLGCGGIESWCATDMMWYAMVGSTALSSERKIVGMTLITWISGSRFDDTLCKFHDNVTPNIFNI